MKPVKVLRLRKVENRFGNVNFGLRVNNYHNFMKSRLISCVLSLRRCNGRSPWHF